MKEPPFFLNKFDGFFPIADRWKFLQLCGVSRSQICMHIACTERTPMFPRTFKEVFVCYGSRARLRKYSCVPSREVWEPFDDIIAQNITMFRAASRVRHSTDLVEAASQIGFS